MERKISPVAQALIQHPDGLPVPGYAFNPINGPDAWIPPGQLLPAQRNRLTGEWRPAVPQGISSVVEALAAPHKAISGLYNQVEYNSDTGEVSQFDPRMVQDAGTLAGAISLSPVGAPLPLGSVGMGFRAFHGSPHSFDKFSMSSIGSGEGAQAFGRGLYFAENPKVADWYRQQLSSTGANTSSLSAAKVLGYYGGDVDKANSHYARLIDQAYANRDMAGAEKLLASKAALASPENLPNPDGNMYEVFIDANEGSFLKWDEPFSEQSPNVKQAILQSLFSSNQEAGAKEIQNLTGGELLKRLGNSRESADILSRSGVPGVIYRDGSSRSGAGDVTNNYVLFGDELVQIKRRTSGGLE